MPANSADVIIVGGGPVGLGLAVELGRRSVRCVLVERHQLPQPIPKGQNLTQRTMEHFHFWGVEQAVRSARTMPPEYRIGGLTDNYDFRALLHQAVGASFDVELVHVGFWDLRFAVADAYRSGRCFIAGDAAHTHPPYGGYGINLGFEDARNLGWKLAARLQGWAGDGLLDSYDEERRPVLQSTARDFIEKAIETDRNFLERFDPERDREAFERAWALRQTGASAEVHAFEPNYEGSPIVWGSAGRRCGAVGSHAFRARAGHHLAPQPLSSGRNIFDELGGGFTLLSLDEARGVAADFDRAASELRLPLKIIRDTPGQGREKYEARYVLIRPDEFVVWAGDQPPSDPAAVLRQAIGATRCS